LFLKEQYYRHERKIEDTINLSPELNAALEGAKEASEKLRALNEEIEVHPDVELLKDIMAAASRREPTINEFINNLPILPRMIFESSQVLAKALNNLFSLIR
jgi:ABC-type transporter Mla subunit MlaD